MIHTILGIVFFALSSACKAFMDASKFRRATAFWWAPDSFYEWMTREGKMPVLKLDDGWHVFQAGFLLFFALGIWMAGGGYGYGLWPFAGAYLVKNAVHYLVFELWLYRRL